MTRVLSGGALIVFAVAVVWFAPPFVFQAVAFVLLVLSVNELVGLARASGLHVPLWLPMTGSLVTLAAFGLEGRQAAPLSIVLGVQMVAIGSASMVGWTSGDKSVMAIVSASLFPSLYLALPLGALVAIREAEGPAVVFLLMLTVMVSDTAQYYTGRAFGRTLLSPANSPKKTIEGAVGGFVFGALVFTLVGTLWLPRVAVALRALVGLTIVALGIAGDLFESMLKRGAGVKDSSTLIPGHGGVLDRIDALLFAAPIYYVVLQYL